MTTINIKSILLVILFILVSRVNFTNYQIAFRQNPDTVNEYNACVAIEDIMMEECNIPDPENECLEDQFHCEINKVIVIK